MAIARAATTVLVLAQLAACAGTGQIHVVSASYGSACGSAAGNQTAHVAAECDGKKTCSHLVDNRFGDPFPGCPKDLSVEWRCHSNAKTRTAGHVAVAGEGYDVTLSCQSRASMAAVAAKSDAAQTDQAAQGRSSTSPAAATPSNKPDPGPDPLVTLARIESDFERTAAGKKRAPIGKSVARDPLEAIVDAYAAFLKGDFASMDAKLSTIPPAAAARRHAVIEKAYDYKEHPDKDPYAPYITRIDALSKDRFPLVRLVAGLRLVDSVLYIEAGGDGDLSLRNPSGMAYASSPLKDTWLRLPCRTIIRRADAFEATAKTLGDDGGPMLSCPTDLKDYHQIESAISDPGSLQTSQRASAPAVTEQSEPQPDRSRKPWDQATALAFMADDPAAAEPALRKAAAKDADAKMDYALFLHAYRPATRRRNAKIQALLNAALKGVPKDELHSDLGDPGGYDGSDGSLVAYIGTAAASDKAAFQYHLPCDVLLARPALLAAIQPQNFSNRDNFLPRTGCGAGKGEMRGFPEAEYQAFEQASETADGGFIENFQGTMKYGFEVQQIATHEAMGIDPRSFLTNEEPVFAYPYQTWGLTSLNNHAEALRLKQLYEALDDRLVAYYLHHGLGQDQAKKVAHTAIFASVFGADCGKGVPSMSLRELLLEGASARVVGDWLHAHGVDDAPEVITCSTDAGLDPMLHVAVGDPDALPLMLERGYDVNQGNAIGKTPLMIAAQFDQLTSARLLLAAKARVEVATSGHLTNDGRTALMYAAANASLPMIKLLIGAGADPYAADTKGHRAIDYLLGFGPTPANPKLSAQERSEAARLLF